MKIYRSLALLAILAFVLAACGKTNATIYQTISAATIKSGDTIPAPKGDVVLTMDGKISQLNAGNTLQFDMATLESLGVVQYSVNDPFAKKKIVYAGVLLSQLLKAAGAAPDATTLTLRALDDYSADMKISDVNKWPILIATRADGAYMPLDQNGPLISVLPFDYFPEIDHVTYDPQWLWSLSKITVK